MGFLKKKCGINKTFIVRSREDMVFGGLAIGARGPDIALAIYKVSVSALRGC
jgi:hypothetical protein